MRIFCGPQETSRIFYRSWSWAGETHRAICYFNHFDEEKNILRTSKNFQNVLRKSQLHNWNRLEKTFCKLLDISRTFYGSWSLNWGNPSSDKLLQSSQRREEYNLWTSRNSQNILWKLEFMLKKSIQRYMIVIVSRRRRIFCGLLETYRIFYRIYSWSWSNPSSDTWLQSSRGGGLCPASF